MSRQASGRRAEGRTTDGGILFTSCILGMGEIGGQREACRYSHFFMAALQHVVCGLFVGSKGKETLSHISF